MSFYDWPEILFDVIIGVGRTTSRSSLYARLWSGKDQKIHDYGQVIDTSKWRTGTIIIMGHNLKKKPSVVKVYVSEAYQEVMQGRRQQKHDSKCHEMHTYRRWEVYMRQTNTPTKYQIWKDKFSMAKIQIHIKGLGVYANEKAIMVKAFLVWREDFV